MSVSVAAIGEPVLVRMDFHQMRGTIDTEWSSLENLLGPDSQHSSDNTEWTERSPTIRYSIRTDVMRKEAGEE
jgi:hypothetical protein